MKNKTYSNFKDALTDKEVEGYIWMVEDKYPKIYSAENGKNIIDFKVLKSDDKPHHKIQEAYVFYDDTSYHIKNIDGKECVFIHKISDFLDAKGFKSKPIKFPSQINGIDNLYFTHVYRLEASISGEDFKTWQPIVRLFQGFKKPINQSKKK